MAHDWEDLAGWWTEEVADDPAYRNQVLPLLLDLLDPKPNGVYLDAGCGEGRVMAEIIKTGATVVGCDVNLELLRDARRQGPVVGCRLPDLKWIKPGSFTGGYASLVVEHLPDLSPFFAGLSAAIASGGPLVLVVNHPLFTAPDSGPVVDPSDGEVYWRWGSYLDQGFTEEPAGTDRVTFYHRPLATLLNSAAEARWSLERVLELGVSPSSRDSLLAAQNHIPRLMGVRWVRA